MKQLIAAAALALAGPALAQAINPLESPDLMKKAINEPGTAWSLYGPGQTSKVVKDKEVPGGEALRVTVGQKGANPWDAGAGYPVLKPIKAGDVIFAAIFMRAPNAKDGETVSVPGSGLGEAAAPYTPLAFKDFRVGNQWQAYYVSAKAAKSYARNTVRVSTQLAADRQVVDLGPAIVLDLGPDYNLATLPQ
jgi:hypothetical protein